MATTTDHTSLDWLGTDALRWAESFNVIAQQVADPNDVGWLISWFANAIEAGRNAGRKETCPHVESDDYGDLRICNLCAKFL